MKNILGFRQFLRSESSYDDLKRIILNREQHFSQEADFSVIVALCGDNPRDFFEDENLTRHVAYYDFAAWEESAQRVAQVYQKSIYHADRVQVIYYSQDAKGLTYPLELLVNIAKGTTAAHLGVSDSDFQMDYSEIRGVFDYHLSKTNAQEKTITYPRRHPRSLDTEKYPINRWAVEDLENMYIYMLSDLKILDSKPDFQSGLSITTRAANSILDFSRVGSWIGNLHMAIQVIRSNGRLLKNFEVRTNMQHESTINFEVQCAKIDQLYRYYMIPLSNIVHLAIEHPDLYLMADWTKGKNKDEISEIIRQIEKLNDKYLEDQRKI